MMFWSEFLTISATVFSLLSIFASHCSGKSYYNSGKDNRNIFADQMRQDNPGKSAEWRSMGKEGALLNAIYGRLGPAEKIDFSRMMYENMAESKISYNRDFSPNAPPNSPFNNGPAGYQQLLSSNEIPSAPEPPNWAAPKYMIELYNKFETDRYSHPLANIVRSFTNIYEEPSMKSRNNKSKTEMRRHVMKFNISSVSRDEEIHLAELRLYTLVEADRKTYFGNDRRVSIYEVLDEEDMANENTIQYALVASKDNVYGRHNGWETFTITDPVKQWVRNDVEMKTLEVRIETIKTRYLSPDIDIDIDTNPHQENEPLLVVFSNDKKKRKSEQRELHEMFMHYANDMHEELGEDYGEDYEEEADQGDDNDKRFYKRDTQQVLKKLQKSTSLQEKHRLGVVTNSSVNGQVMYSSKNTSMDIQRQSISREMSKRQMLKKLYKKILEMSAEEDNQTERNITLSRVRRSKAKKKKARRTSCRRKPLQVKFSDINWHTWIIAPKSYDAYECTGKCYFPLNDHLTPTKHAIIQTLLHTNYPNKASRACCVPTKLDPISILYVDEKRVVTYKYKYEGMVVAQCGCR